MGTHVILDIVPDRIRAEDWAEIYDTTLRLLRAHPSRLMGADWLMVCGTRLPVYTRSIERHVDVPARRHWCVLGDHASLRTAESQTMYRDLRHYLRGRPPLTSAAGPSGDAPHRAVADILCYAADERHRDTGGPAQVFGGQTRGAPYSVPVLAAAIVVENRFPLHAMVWGDFDRGRAEAARRLAERTLKVPVALPVRADAPRLVDRLRRFLEGDALLRAVERLCLDRPARQLPAWAGLPDAPPGAGEGDGVQDLAVLRSPDDLSARRRDDLHALALGVRKLSRRIREGAAAAGAGQSASTRGLALVLGSGDASALRRSIAQMLSQRGPILTEDAWDRLAREDDLAVLDFLVVLAAVRSGSPDFLHLQRAMFESTALCRYVVDAANDGPLMDRLAEKVDALWLERPAPSNGAR